MNQKEIKLNLINIWLLFLNYLYDVILNKINDWNSEENKTKVPTRIKKKKPFKNSHSNLLLLSTAYFLLLLYF